MPIYEYVCGDCRHEFEVLVRGSEQVQCEACGGAQLKKLLSVPAAHTNPSGQDLPMCKAPGVGPCGMGGCGMPECGL